MNTKFFENPISRSFGLHVLLALFVFFYLTQIQTLFPSNSPIEVTYLDQKKETTLPEEKKEALAKPILPKKMEEERSKRIVQRSEGELANEAKKNAYLSDKTRTVDEERSSRHSGEVESNKIEVVPLMPGGRPQTASREQTDTPKAITLGDLGVKVLKTPKKNFAQDRNWADPALGETMKGGEYIQGMKEGETSALNTKESIFFSYFDRVRRQLDQSWEPILRENIAHIFKVGRRLASNTDYVTAVEITMNPHGEVQKVQIVEESGTHDLDQAAIDALNKAGPYPNPPKGLVDATGSVHIHWNFILKT